MTVRYVLIPDDFVFMLVLMDPYLKSEQHKIMLFTLSYKIKQKGVEKSFIFRQQEIGIETRGGSDVTN